MDILATQIYEEDESLPATQKIGQKEAKDTRQVGVLIIGANTYAINKGVTTLGRHPSCTIVINDQTVSKQHAEIEASAVSTPSTWICDLKSANRTKLNNLVLKPGRSYEVKTGSVISLGRIRAVYKHHLPSQNPDESMIPETPDLRSRRQQIIPSTPDSSLNNSSGLDEPSTIPATQDEVFQRPSIPGGLNRSRNADERRNEHRNENGLSIHDLETQGQEEDIHDMETQKICFVRPTSTGSINRRRSSVDIHEVETQKEDPAKASGQTDFRSEPPPGGDLGSNQGPKSQEVEGSRSVVTPDRVIQEVEEGPKSPEDRLRLSFTSDPEFDDDPNESVHYMGSQNVLELVAGPVDLETPAERRERSSEDEENIFEMQTQDPGDQDQDEGVFEAPTQKIQRDKGPPESQDDSDTDQEGVFLRYLRDSQTDSQDEPNFRRQAPSTEPEKPNEPEEPKNRPDQPNSAQPAGTGLDEISLGRGQPKNRPDKSIGSARRSSFGPDHSASGSRESEIRPGAPSSVSAPSDLGSASGQANLDIADPAGPSSRSTEPKNRLQPDGGARVETREVRHEKIPEGEDSDTDKEGIFEELAQKAKRISLELTQAQGQERNDLGTSTDSYDLFDAATQKLNSSGEDLSNGPKEITKTVQKSGPSLNMADRPGPINVGSGQTDRSGSTDDRLEPMDDDAPTQIIRVAGFRLQEESLELVESQKVSQGQKESEDLDCLPTQLIGEFEREDGGDEGCSDYEMAATQVLSEVRGGLEGSDGPNRLEDKSKSPEEHGGTNSVGSEDPRTDAAEINDKSPGQGSARDSEGPHQRLSIYPPGCSRTTGLKEFKRLKKANLDDTIERNLNDLFQDEKEEDHAEEATQISTQTLQRVLQSSQLEPSSNDEEEPTNRRSPKRKRRSLKNTGDLGKRGSSLNKSSESENELNESDGDQPEVARGSGKNRRRGSNRFGKSDRSRLDRSDRPSRSSENRLAEPHKANRSGILDKAKRSDGSNELDRSSVNRIEEMEKPSRSDRMDQLDRSNTLEKLERSKRSNGPSKSNRSSVNSQNRLHSLDEPEPEVRPGSTEKSNEELSKNQNRGGRAIENLGQVESENSNSIQTSLADVDESEKKNPNNTLEKTSEDSTIIKDSDEDILAGLPEVRISGTLSNPGSPTTSVGNFRLDLHNTRGRYERGRKSTRKTKRTQRLEDYLEKDDRSSRTSSRDEEESTKKVRRSRRKDMDDLENEEGSLRMRKDKQDQGRGKQDVNKDSTNRASKIKEAMNKPSRTKKSVEVSTSKASTDEESTLNQASTTKQPTTKESTNKTTTKQPTNKPSRSRESTNKTIATKESINQPSTNRASTIKQPTSKSSATKESANKSSTNEASEEKSSGTKDPARSQRRATTDFRELNGAEQEATPWRRSGSQQESTSTRMSQRQGGTGLIGSSVFQVARQVGGKLARVTDNHSVTLADGSQVELQTAVIKVVKMDHPPEVKPKEASRLRRGARRPKVLTEEVGQESQEVQMILQNGSGKDAKEDANLDRIYKVRGSAKTRNSGPGLGGSVPEKRTRESQEGVLERRTRGSQDGVLERRTRGSQEGVLERRTRGSQEGVLERRTRGSVSKGPGPEESVLEERTKGPGPKESVLEERTKGPGPRESVLEERTSRTRGPASKRPAPEESVLEERTKGPGPRESVLEERTSRTRGPASKRPTPEGSVLEERTKGPGPKESVLEGRTTTTRGPAFKRPAPEESVLEERATRTRGSVSRNASFKRAGESILEESKINPRVPRSEEKVTRHVKRTRSDSDSTEGEKFDARLQQPKRLRRNKPIKMDSSDSLKIEDSSSSGGPLNSSSSMDGKELHLSVSFSSPGRIRHRILFTGVPTSEYSMFLTRLGAAQVEDPRRCTVLVTDKVRRTVKFLCALALSVPIVSVEWLTESAKRCSYVDFEGYILKDPVAEAKFGFRLRKSLDKAKHQRLLDEYTIVLTSNVAPPPIPELKSIIQACGGKALIRPPGVWPKKSLILSKEEDLQNARRILAKAPATVTIQSVEFLLTGILRQELDFVTHRLK